MIKVLQLVGGGEAIGGVEKMLLSYYSFMDREKVCFDFCFYRKSTVEADQNVTNGLLSRSQVFDLRAFESTGIFSGYVRSIKRVAEIIKNNGYDIVHINAGRPPLLICGLISAKKAGVKKIIIHSHSTKGVSNRSTITDFVYRMMSLALRSVFRRNATILAGCSKEAAQFMFGKSVTSTSKYMPVRNAIVVKPFLFNKGLRQQVREEMQADEKTLVVGHVGSFSTPKNHLFLIDVYYEIKKRIPNSKLWLAGNGNLKEGAEQYAKDLGLQNDVLFLGERKDANRLYQGMDMMVFPSLWEGLSVSIVEAQAASLPVFASSNISPEHKITNKLRFVDLSKGAEFWAEYIIKEMQNEVNRKDMTDQITQRGYNIEVEAAALQNTYIKMINVN